MRIRESVANDFEAILGNSFKNDAAQAYRGVIPNDRWHEPYMSADELRKRCSGVIFWMAEDTGRCERDGNSDKEDVAWFDMPIPRQRYQEERPVSQSCLVT